MHQFVEINTKESNPFDNEPVSSTGSFPAQAIIPVAVKAANATIAIDLLDDY